MIPDYDQVLPVIIMWCERIKVMTLRVGHFTDTTRDDTTRDETTRDD